MRTTIRNMALLLLFLVGIDQAAMANEVNPITLGSAVLYSGATSAERSNWATRVSCSFNVLTARHIAVTAPFRLYDEAFDDPEAYGLNIRNAELVDILSPFFKDPTGTNYEFDVDRGDAEWALSYYETRGPREADYGRTSRNGRPVASYAWGTVANIQQNGDELVFDLLFDPGLVDGSASFGEPIGAAGWHVTFNLATTSGASEVMANTCCIMASAGLGGRVSPAMTNTPRGTDVSFDITPDLYFQIDAILTNGAVAGRNLGSTPMVYVWSNVVSTGTLHATFVEQTGSQHGTPFTWMAHHGYTSDMPNAELLIGNNGMVVWQSYVAGINPNCPTSRLACINMGWSAFGYALQVETVTGRLYTVYYADSLPSANEWSLTLTHDAPGTGDPLVLYDSDPGSRRYYRLKVRLP